MMRPAPRPRTVLSGPARVQNVWTLEPGVMGWHMVAARCPLPPSQPEGGAESEREGTSVQGGAGQLPLTEEEAARGGPS